MSEIAKAFDPKLVEEKWYSFWEEGGYFKADPHSDKEPFCIVIPPPNVTGVLHMGHALVDTLQDILIRWKRMQGFEALWIPGTDHAGIATQGVVEKKLYAETGKRRKDFDREEFLTHVWNWKELSEGQILGQLKKLGCSCDWSRLRFTMDEGCNKAVETVFKKMFDEKLIYRGDYLVNWDPITQTALSDDEVEHEERDSFLWHIEYPVIGGGSLIVATTRPETMLGDTAVAVHPTDERYASLIGKKIKLPLTHREIPIIADPFVDKSFGSGAVKITPAHDFNDFEVAHRNKLPMINIMTPDGHILNGPYAGKSMEEARSAVIHDLGKHIVKKEPHKLRVGISYRSKAVIQPYLSKQWFIKMSHFKEKLISAVKEKRVTLIPPHWEETYFHWIENLRDWCISRQLWWGHRIPVWYKGDQVLCPTPGETPDESWTQDPDVLDTWFSSALWPFSTLGFPEKSADLKKFYPTATLITGHDILFFWVARMIMMGEYVMKDVPFKESFLHGLIYGKSYWRNTSHGAVYVKAEERCKFDLGEPIAKDVESKWEKMSKSKGNVIDPLEIIDTYGTDAMRLALCSSVTHARQIDLDLRRFEEYKNFANKIWNGSRFVFMNLEGFEATSLMQGLDFDLLTLEDRWILSLLNRTTSEINRNLAEYTFDKAATRAYEFFWNDFCATYVELAKPVLFGKTGTPELKTNKQRLLVILLCHSIRLMHPISPFITEEIFSLLKAHFPTLTQTKPDPYTEDAIKSLLAPACIVAPYPESFGQVAPAEEKAFEEILEIVKQVRNIRAEMQLPPSEKTELIISGKHFTKTERNQHIITGLTPTSKIEFTTHAPKGFGASALIGELQLIVPIPESFKQKEQARLEKEKLKLEALQQQTKAKLSNEEFRARAPKEIVEKLEQTLAQTEKQLSEIASKLN
jgi:valyl-tRNA synthetase